MGNFYLNFVNQNIKANNHLKIRHFRLGKLMSFHTFVAHFELKKHGDLYAYS